MKPVSARQTARLPALTLAALGVVFGDIGTDPLYAIAQCFQDTPGMATRPEAVIGILSLIIWSIVLVVCVKYLGLVMRADHHGEGGTLALLGLLHEAQGKPQRREGTRQGGRTIPPMRPGLLTLLVLFGCALLYGDGVVTPAISVLSAVEGLNVATTEFKSFVVPISVVILLGLFLLQSRGTELVGRLFGPVMVLWFLAIGLLGLRGVLAHPAILVAFDPRYGVAFLLGHGWEGYGVLGAVVLAFSGAEALFADLGHFGRRPITLAWYGLVLPALLLNFLGQGGLVLSDAHAAGQPFYGLVPRLALYPMIVLSTAATVIASQALISGAFSLTQQAVAMGYCPRFAVIHTSSEERGQIYMPAVNAFLMVLCIVLVVGFRSSDALGAAYGLAVIGTMTITSVVFFQVMRQVWAWSLPVAGGLLGIFLVVDFAFLGANLAKIFAGAWVPLVIGAFVFFVFAAWTDGRARYRRALATWAMPLEQFQREMAADTRERVGTAVLLAPDPKTVPLVGRHTWLHEQMAQEHVLLLTIVNAPVPRVALANQVRVETLCDGLHRVWARFGYMQRIDVGAALAGARRAGLQIDWQRLVFYLPQPVVTGRGSRLRRLTAWLFLFLGRMGLSPVEYFQIRPGQAVAVGLELEM